ncbi:MAG: DUF3616 domain-containing protein [Aphanothece sp. CMT-3BRIN-NPC111]|jgi:hypothetical protein|nr:DUF3616 domain-containing protein [Aphanothece sp. CMT-3BRIN-NPC111]
MENNSFLNRVLLQFQDGSKQLREDISAIVLTPEGHLWLGADETTTVERLDPTDSDTFEEHQQFPVSDFIYLPAGTEQEIDIEGLDYANHYLWLVGSHSWKRKKNKSNKTDLENIKRLATIESEANRYILARIPLVDGQLFKSCKHPDNPKQQLSAATLQLTKKANVLMDALAKDPHLSSFIVGKIPSKDNGLDIEGIAVNQNSIFLGLRGPVLRGWAIILELELKEISPNILKLKPIGEDGHLYKKHFVDLMGLGIRDLCWHGQDLLILAGPTMVLDGPVKVFRLKNGINRQENVLLKPEPVLDISYGDRVDHAEGITLFGGMPDKPSILVVYDSPAPQTRLEGENGIFADVFQL